MTAASTPPPLARRLARRIRPSTPAWHLGRRRLRLAPRVLGRRRLHAAVSSIFWRLIPSNGGEVLLLHLHRPTAGRGRRYHPPLGPSMLGVDPSQNVLQRIQIKYVEDDEGIRKYFVAFHLLDNFPAAVIVDDFAEFFSERTCQQRYGNTRARDLAVVRILALCQNAIAYATAKIGTLGTCNLLLSDVHQGDTPRSLFIYKRWISSIYTIQGDGLGSYVIKNISCSKNGTKEARTAKYSIALQYLVLEEISNG